MDGWGKTKSAAKYGDVSVRTLQDWFKNGLKHSRLPSGTILVKYSDIDAFLSQFEVDRNEVDAIVNDITKNL